MQGTKTAGRMALAVLAAGLLTACRDVGLSFNIPLEEAENRAFRYAVYEDGTGDPLLRFDDRNWMASAAVEHIPERALREVGTARGRAVYAPTWETAPYDRVYVRSGAGWHPVTPVQ